MFVHWRVLAGRIRILRVPRSASRAAQFKLRSLLLLMIGLCFVLATESSRERSRRDARDLLLRAGGTFEIREIAGDLRRRLINKLIRVIRADEYQELRVIYLYNCSTLDDGDLAGLRAFPEVETLLLNGSHVTSRGVAYVAGCVHLKELGMSGTGVTDEAIEHLVSLNELQELDLGWTQITDVGAAKLAKLQCLKRVVLTRSRVTPRGIEILRDRMPKCEIVYSRMSY